MRPTQSDKSPLQIARIVLQSTRNGFDAIALLRNRMSDPAVSVDAIYSAANYLCIFTVLRRFLLRTT